MKHAESEADNVGHEVDRIDKAELQESVEAVMQLTVHNVRQYWPLRGRESNSEYDDFFNDMEDLGLSKDELIERSNKVGRTVYDDRFTGSLIATALIGHNLDPLMAFPEKNPYYLRVVRFLGAQKSKLQALKSKWAEQKELSGIVTTPTFIETAGSLEEQYEGFITNGWDVDVYSSSKRSYYPLQSAINALKDKGGTFVDVGTAAGDLVLAMSPNFDKAIGVDNVSIQDVVRTPMMRDYRFKSEDEALVHLTQLNRAGIKMEACDMFDLEQLQLLLQDASRPLVIVSMNSLFPHFDSDHVTKGVEIVAKLKPDIYALGGMVPALELKDNNGAWISKRVTPIFDFSTGKPVLIETVVA